MFQDLRLSIDGVRALDDLMRPAARLKTPGQPAGDAASTALAFLPQPFIIPPPSLVVSKKPTPAWMRLSFPCSPWFTSA